MMRRSYRMIAGVLAGGMLLSGCYGPFELTRRVHRWNGQVSDNKWIVEVVFLALSWLPVYGIATAADAVIFNSVEFWTGNNPLRGANAEGVQTRHIVRGDNEAIIKRVASEGGEEFVIEQFHRGQPGPSLRIMRQGDATVALNEEGAKLFSAKARTDGGVVVHDADGRQVASYSGTQVERFLASARR